MQKLLQPSTRFGSPTSGAGTYRDYALPVRDGGERLDQLGYFVVVHEASDPSNTLLKLSLSHGPDERTSVTHTSSVIAATTVSSVPSAFGGTADPTVGLAPFLHPTLSIGTNDGNPQWVLASVWQMGKRFPMGRGTAFTRRVLEPTRIDSGSAGSSPGYLLQTNAGGSQMRTLLYMVSVHMYSAGAELGFEIAHSPDGKTWLTQELHAVTALSGTAPILLAYACDTSEVIAEHYRPILKTQSSAGDSMLVEVFETAKPV